MCYGFDTIETGKLAYEIATPHKLKMPTSWEVRPIAGKNSLYGCENQKPASFKRHVL